MLNAKCLRLNDFLIQFKIHHSQFNIQHLICGMSSLNEQLAKIESFKLEHRIIKQVVEQIKKDFDDVRVEVKIGKDGSPYEQLKKQIYPIIEWMFEKRPERLFALFYRIDIPEHRVKQLLHGDVEGDVVEQYTDLILQRELQKVIIRNFYSTGSSAE